MDSSQGNSKLTVTGYGPEANAALVSAVQRAKHGDALAPVTVVVPTHYLGLAARRALAAHPGRVAAAVSGARRAGIAAVSFITVYDLAERLGGRRVAAAGLKPVSTPVIAGAVRTVLRRDPGYFAGVERHPATERRLVDAHRELSEASASGLDALARQSPRAADVVRIHRAVARALREEFSNEQRLADEAVTLLDDDPGAAEGIGAVIVFLPQHLTRHQARMLRAVSVSTDTTIIAGLTGAPDADAAVKASLARLRVSPDGVSAHTMSAHSIGAHSVGADSVSAHSVSAHSIGTAGARPGAASTEPIKPGIGALRQLLKGRDVTALSVSDADDEVRHAVREVVSAARAGTRLDRCSILYGAHAPYNRLIGDALDAAGIQRCGAAVHTPAASWLGRSLLGLLALRENGLDRRGVMSWLDTAQVRISGAGSGDMGDDPAHRDLRVQARPISGAGSGDMGDDGSDRRRLRQRAPVAAWERAARAARVEEAGVQDWARRLKTYISHRRSESVRIQGDEERLWLSRRFARDAQRAEDLLAFIREFHAQLNPEPFPDTWAGLARWCRGLIRRYLGGHWRNGWPPEEKRLATRVDAAIDRLGDLDGIDDAPSPARFRQALELELDGGAHTHGRFGTGVLVGPVELAIGVELDLAVVCGMAEGTFPARRREDALLPDRERRSTGDDLPLRGDRSGDDRRALLAVLAAARRCVLLYPRGDLRRSAERSPSRWLLDTAEALDGIRPRGEELARASGGWFDEVPSFTAGLRRTEFPAHSQEYDTRALADWHDKHRIRGEPGTGPGGLLELDVVRRRPELRRGIELRLARRSRRLTRFDGNLSTDGDLRGVRLPHPAQETTITSASKLESWVKCPHAYFVRHVLQVDAIDDDRDNHRISPIDLGRLIHGILECWLKEAIEAGEAPRPVKPWPRRWRSRLLEIADEHCDRLEARGLVGRRLYWHGDRHWHGDRQRVLADLDRFVDFDNERRALHRSTPVAAELGFGMPGSPLPPVTIDLDTDSSPRRTLRIRGLIDRLDRTDEGGSVVIDYKTGNISPYQKLSAENPTPGGSCLQLVLYALAAKELKRLNTDSNAGFASCTSAHDPGGSHGSYKSHVSAGPGSAGADHGAYWFVTSKGGFKFKGYDVAEASEQVLKTVGGIVGGIESGLFPLRPEQPDKRPPWVTCPFCEPDGLGIRAVWLDWKHKRDDPILKDYAELIATVDDNPNAAS